MAGQEFADYLFRQSLTVHIRGINMIDAQFKRGSQYIKRLFLGRGTVKVSEGHSTNTDS